MNVRFATGRISWPATAVATWVVGMRSVGRGAMADGRHLTPAALTALLVRASPGCDCMTGAMVARGLRQGRRVNLATSASVSAVQERDLVAGFVVFAVREGALVASFLFLRGS